MSEPFLGEITMFAGTFAPRGWAFCDGQLLEISQNDALFAVFGTIYGGDGRQTFALPDLRGRVPIHKGQGPGLVNRPLGQRSGAESHVLSVGELPPHNHALFASTDLAGDTSPAGNVTATSTSSNLYGDAGVTDMRGDAVGPTGSGQPHDNVMPFQCINFIVALFGLFPSQS